MLSFHFHSEFEMTFVSIEEERVTYTTAWRSRGKSHLDSFSISYIKIFLYSCRTSKKRQHSCADFYSIGGEDETLGPRSVSLVSTFHGSSKVR